VRFKFNRLKVYGKSEQLITEAIFAAVLVLSSSTAAARWEEKLFNPKPLPDDVILPMPCDGAMVFRKIYVPLSRPLDDYAITLGQDSAEWGYLEQARPSFIAGSFSASKPEEGRYYLLAKYEMNELQYQSFMGDQCPTPATKLRLPQTGISWFEAISFADKYNLWLRENFTEQIPKEDNISGFLRLPTEVEWEFAARGGLAVSEAEFRDVRFPTPDGGLGAYAWFAGAQSSNGKLQLAGLLKPNPVGLHDILGNVDEMLFEPFRLNKLDRQHGQAGGYILRGGNFRTTQAELRTALRSEQPYYANSSVEQTKLKTSGIRLVMVAPTLTSRDRIKEIEGQWKKLGDTSDVDAVEKNQPIKADPVEEIGNIADSVKDNELKQQLEKLRSDLRAHTQARDEQRDQAIRSELQLGAFLCTKIKDDGLFLDTLEGNFSQSCGVNSTQPKERCEKRTKQIEAHRNVLNFVLNYYADTVVSGALNYKPNDIKSQVTVVEQQMSARRKNNLREYLNTHWNNLKGYINSGKVERSQWLINCKSTS
jgi:formylglycine-generating enzyme required for sulfatase activity